ncbi:hypothetical protein GQ44DRAFT_602193 [Phaeosphaeriaceae sp. PMI808]|nr:hypothetical protein GQ44DRAFT_602193 [Phaeosphaeriaceae sp. PMI808]
MTGKIGPLAAPIVALIVAGGIFVCLVLITLTAWLCDLPNRIRRRKAAKKNGNPRTILDDAEVEKGEPDVSVTEVDSQVSQVSKSSQNTRAPSPECQCQHPNIYSVSYSHQV